MEQFLILYDSQPRAETAFRDSIIIVDMSSDARERIVGESENKSVPERVARQRMHPMIALQHK